MTFQFGIDALIADSSALARLRQQRVGIVVHPASVTENLTHTLDALVKAGVVPHYVFGPQHGARGDKQDNMIESDDYVDPTHQIPVLSLYGEHRRPTPAMLANLDVVLFDLQDLGCRIYTYITTLQYFLEAAADSNIEICVLDRPNPAGRGIDGTLLEAGEESFVGAVPIPCRYGLTIGELAHWMNDRLAYPAKLSVVRMTGYHLSDPREPDWPSKATWVNPSPNASSLNMAKCFSGTVLLEGTHLSEGRGTTLPLEVFGSPDFPATEIKHQIEDEIGEALGGGVLRVHYFEPTFHKYQGQLCQGLQIHTDRPGFDSNQFQPYRLIACMLKILKQLEPNQALWRDHAYEYELDRRPIDVINGGPFLRQWVDNPHSTLSDMQLKLDADHRLWRKSATPYYYY